MDLTPSDEQRLLRESADRFVSETYIADGSLYLAFAHSERQARYDLADVTTTAKKTPDGWRLDGHKTAVLDGNAAGQIIVSARVNDANGKLCLFLVPQGARGLTLRD